MTLRTDGYDAGWLGSNNGFRGDSVLGRSGKSTISDRIRFAREQSQLEPAELRDKLKARGLTISKGALHRLENIEPTNPNLKLILAIAEITKFSPGWILFGKGPAISPDEAGNAIRGRVIDTIELVAGALDLTARQEQTLRNWLESVRSTKPKHIRRP